MLPEYPAPAPWGGLCGGLQRWQGIFLEGFAYTQASRITQGLRQRWCCWPRSLLPLQLSEPSRLAALLSSAQWVVLNERCKALSLCLVFITVILSSAVVSLTP